MSSAGIAFAAAVESGTDKIKSGGEEAKEEIEKLQQKYSELDKRTKILMRVFLFVTGLDILLML